MTSRLLALGPSQLVNVPFKVKGLKGKLEGEGIVL